MRLVSDPQTADGHQFYLDAGDRPMGGNPVRKTSCPVGGADSVLSAGGAGTVKSEGAYVLRLAPAGNLAP